MTRFMFVLIFAIVSPALGVAQAPGIIDRPMEDILLRLQPSAGWAISVDENGVPYTAEFFQMVDGVAVVELNPSTAAAYQQHQVTDALLYSANVTTVSGYDFDIASGVTIRLTRLADEVMAAQYLPTVYAGQVEATALGEIPDRQLAEMETLPEFDHPIVGWTGVEGYIQNETGEVVAYASYIRYVAQVDNYVVSVTVTGPLVDYNFDAAFWLLQDQAACVVAETPCQPVDMPLGDTDYQFIGDTFVFNNYAEGGEAIGVRGLYPVDTPVRAPLYSVSFAPSDAQVTEESTNATQGAGTAVMGPSLGPVRSDPMLESEFVDNITSDETVTLSGEYIDADDLNWAQITTSRGITGWVPTEWLSMD